MASYIISNNFFDKSVHHHVDVPFPTQSAPFGDGFMVDAGIVQAIKELNLNLDDFPTKEATQEMYNRIWEKTINGATVKSKYSPDGRHSLQPTAASIRRDINTHRGDKMEEFDNGKIKAQAKFKAAHKCRIGDNGELYRLSGADDWKYVIPLEMAHVALVWGHADHQGRDGTFKKLSDRFHTLNLSKSTVAEWIALCPRCKHKGGRKAGPKPTTPEPTTARGLPSPPDSGREKKPLVGGMVCEQYQVPHTPGSNMRSGILSPPSPFNAVYETRFPCVHFNGVTGCRFGCDLSQTYPRAPQVIEDRTMFAAQPEQGGLAAAQGTLAATPYQDIDPRLLALPDPNLDPDFSFRKFAGPPTPENDDTTGLEAGAQAAPLGSAPAPAPLTGRDAMDLDRPDYSNDPSLDLDSDILSYPPLHSPEESVFTPMHPYFGDLSESLMFVALSEYLHS